MNNFTMRTNYQSIDNSINSISTKVLIITDGNQIDCAFYQLGLALDKILCQNKSAIKYDHYFIKDLVTLKNILRHNKYDALVVNGRKDTIPYVNKKTLNDLEIPLIKFGGDTSQRLGNDFDRSDFDFWFVDDVNYVLYNPYVLKIG